MKYKLLNENENKLRKSGGFLTKKKNFIRLMNSTNFDDIKIKFSNPLLKNVIEKNKNMRNSYIKMKDKNMEKGICSTDFYIKRSRKKLNDIIFNYSNILTDQKNNSEMRGTNYKNFIEIKEINNNKNNNLSIISDYCAKNNLNFQSSYNNNISIYVNDINNINFSNIKVDKFSNAVPPNIFFHTKFRNLKNSFKLAKSENFSNNFYSFRNFQQLKKIPDITENKKNVDNYNSFSSRDYHYNVHREKIDDIKENIIHKILEDISNDDNKKSDIKSQLNKKSHMNILTLLKLKNNIKKIEIK